MAMPDIPTNPPLPKDGSLFMRPFALAATAYLFTSNLLYVLTQGTFPLPDRWADVYMVILGVYGGAPEIKKLAHRSDEALSGDWDEPIRKGGPLVTLWFLLLAGVGILRHWDTSYPMPPELRAITLQTIGVFFGTYALRQYRKGRLPANADSALETQKAKVMEFLRLQGPSSPKTISDATQIPRRTLSRLLADLIVTRQVFRDADSPKDPSGTYRVSSNPL